MKYFKSINLIIIVLLNLPSSAYAKNDCPLQITFNQNGIDVCAYDVVIHAANTTRSTSVLEIPTAIIVNISTAIVGLAGTLAKDSYNNEGSNRYVNMKPSEEHKNYQMCAYVHEIWSETGTSNYDNKNTVTNTLGHFEWTLNRPGLGQGRNWYKADFVWVSKHPSYPLNDTECKDISSKTIVAMRKIRPIIPGRVPESRHCPRACPDSCSKDLICY